MTHEIQQLCATPASWIWCDADSHAGGRLAQFRLTFSADAPACWTGFADTAYTLCCNGHVLGIGPVHGGAYRP